MAYQVTPGLTTPRAVLEALNTFAAANGWTVVYANALTEFVYEMCLHIPGVTDYVYLWSSASEIRSRISIGYTPGQPITAQPNVTPADSVSNALGSGNFPRTWFFANGSEFDLVILRSDGPSYCHIAFGALQKYGVYDGGTYADGTYFNQTGTSSGLWEPNNDHGLFGYGSSNAGYLRADCAPDGRSNFYHRFTHQATNQAGALTGIAPPSAANLASNESSTNLLARLGYAADDNVFSGRHFGHIIEPWVRRLGEAAYFSPAGYFANRRSVSLANYDPEQEVNIAGDTWKMFPVVRKIASSQVNNAPNSSGDVGFALRMVT